jgi:hypothetical protein
MPASRGALAKPGRASPRDSHADSSGPKVLPLQRWPIHRHSHQCCRLPEQETQWTANSMFTANVAIYGTAAGPCTLRNQTVEPCGTSHTALT